MRPFHTRSSNGGGRVKARRKQAGWLPILALLLAGAYAALDGRLDLDPIAPQSASDDSTRIVELYESRASKQVVEASGTVVHILPDDNDGSRHQRFLVDLAGGHTLLISHNIDLAPRVPGLRKGDVIEFRGQYEWNDKGGVIHWTHHDPGGRRPGGWLRLRGETYR